MKSRNAVAALIGCLLVSFAVWAADNEGAYTLIKGQSESYWRDNQTALQYSALDGTDTITNVDVASDAGLMRLLDDTSSNSTSLVANGRGVRQNVPISARFTNAAATCDIYVVYYNKIDDTTFFTLGVEGPITLTAGLAQDGTGAYIAPSDVRDSYGATHCAVLCTDVSAGTVSLAVGSY